MSAIVQLGFRLVFNITKVHNEQLRHPQHNRLQQNRISSRACSYSPLQLCAETFSDMMLLNVHIKQHHVAQERTSDNCTCYICDKAYGSFGVLYSHIKQHHNTTALAPNETVTRICHLCGHTLLGIEDMKNHLANHHYAYSFYSCNMCNTTSSSLQTFKEHLNSEHDIAGTAPCLTCDNAIPHKNHSCIRHSQPL